MISFHKQLVLNQWMLSLFKVSTLAELKAWLGNDRYEGIADDGQTRFFDVLYHHLATDERLDRRDMRRYDVNIVQYWKTITERRNLMENTVLHMKYFQYLSLLFTEIYLDWYFNRRQALLNGLNEQLETYNNQHKATDRFVRFDADELNKLAFWSATGTGKTLLLHVNILQYLHYFQQGNKNSYPDNIILLTPNEGLSHQHLAELRLSGFSHCHFFNKNQGNLFKEAISIIDINKLGDVMGDKTIAVDAFEGNNLVLVDEGHRGTGTAAGAWMRRRETLVRGGFAFEYSATFGQAVANGLTVTEAEAEIQKKNCKLLFGTADVKKIDAQQKQQLQLTSDEKNKARVMATREIYAKNILLDYSYRYFYEDGYGKESMILNLKDDAYAQDDIKYQYFTACLLSFYQQQYLWSAHQGALAEFNLEKPLWIFVGNTVSGEDSDVLNVLRFFADFLNEEAKIKQWLSQLLANTLLLPNNKGENIFHDRFTPLMHLQIDEVYSDIIRKLFNANAAQRLKVINVKRSKGELALRVGDAAPFGVINIGDDATFFKEAEKAENAQWFDTETDEFGESLFHNLNSKDSQLNVLIGSRKFTEGWSSWRVSTMGLLNMGKGEGSQIIQLFGRGVRLKGRNYSLKRSVPAQRPKGMHVERLETLNIFGVNAGYMGSFKEYLKEAGVTPSDELIQLDFPIRHNLTKANLKTLSLAEGYRENDRHGFKRTNFPCLYQIPTELAGSIKIPHIELNLYPKIEAMSTQTKLASVSENAHFSHTHYSGKIPNNAMALFDFDRIFLAISEFKQQRNWHNLRLERNALFDFCQKYNDWYALYIPKNELNISSIADIEKLEDILIQFLKDYTDCFYRTLKAAYEGQYYRVVDLKEEDGIIDQFHFDIDNTPEGADYERKIIELQALVESGKLGEANRWEAGQMVAICFEPQLYYPWFNLGGKVPLKMHPLVFDSEYEIRFVRDLQKFYESTHGRSVIGDRSLYLLRNSDHKSRGLGFALAGNFYPDFLLWLVDDKTGKQWLNFVEPKGLSRVDLDGAKFNLFQEVKKIQDDLKDDGFILNAFILSGTPFLDVPNLKYSEKDLQVKHVLFMEEAGLKYLTKMFEMMV